MHCMSKARNIRVAESMRKKRGEYKQNVHMSFSFKSAFPKWKRYI